MIDLSRSASAPHLCWNAARHGPFDTMAEPLQTTQLSSTPPAAASTGFVEKTPLERYVPPAKPSLVGLSRAQLTEALASIDVPAAQRKMRAQQIWHWLYVRGARGVDTLVISSKPRAPRKIGRAHV